MQRGRPINKVHFATLATHVLRCILTERWIDLVPTTCTVACITVVFTLLTAGARPQSKTHARRIVVPANLDIAQAMTMFYGNYDPKARQSVVSALHTPSSNSTWLGQRLTIARPLFGAVTAGLGTHHFMLLTYGVPSDVPFDCHACSPVVGMAVFTQSGQSWKIEASNDAVTYAGEFGNPPTDIQLVEIGPRRRAVKIRDVGGGSGQTSAVLLILIPWNGTVNLGLERIIADDDEGACGVESGLPCYANRRTITFRRGDTPDYYDLELRLSGTDISDGPPYMLIHVRGVERLRLKDGKYTQLFRHGDLTSLDRGVAKREGLE